LARFSSDSGLGSSPIGYIALEQQVGETSPQSDLYALGATLIYLLTGQEPDTFYRLGNLEQCFHLKEVPGISANMAEVLQKLTHPNPSQRFESAASAADAFQLLL
jgi:serine/threonine-protein kinase